MNKILKKSAISFAVGAAVAALSTVSLAEGDTKRSPRGSIASLLEEVVVTAQKKSNAEALQDVPIAISAYSGGQVEAMHAEKLSDVGLMAPNVRLQNVGTLPGVANFTIRGMGFLASTAAIDPTVSVVVDGVTLGTTYGAQMDTFDVETIEMLRGPQGTLFGRNVTGGAVSIRSKRPTGEFGAKIKAATGTANRRDISLAVEGALIEDTLAARLTLMSKDRDSYFKNVNYPGINVLTGQPFNNVETAGDNIGAEDSLFARGVLVFTPNDELEVTLLAESGEVNSAGSTGRIQTVTAQFDANGDIFRFPGLPEGATVGLQEAGSVLNRGELAHDTKGDSVTDWEQVTVEVNWDVGPGTITSITGYRAVDVDSFNDIDAGPYTSTIYDITLGQHQFSEEIRYNANLLDDKLNLTIGGMYFSQVTDSRERLVFGVAELGGLDFTRGGDVEHESYGLFTQSDFSLTDTVTLQAGIRYSWEEKIADLYGFNGCTSDLVTCNPAFEDSRDWSNVGGKLGILWTPSADMLVYGQATRAFRSGGFNVRATSAAAAEPYDEEEVNALEVGLKSEFFDGSLRLNAAIFYNEYVDLQRVILDATRPGVQNIQNAAAATIQGIEIESTWLVTDSFVITAAVGYLDAAYDDFPGFDVDGDGTPDPVEAAKLTLERAPELTYSLSANYDIYAGNIGYFSLRTSYSYTDERPVNVQNSVFHSDYGLLDASITWSDPSDRVKVSLFGKNLTYEEYGHTGAFFAGLFYEYYETPRTWGLDASYTF